MTQDQLTVALEMCANFLTRLAELVRTDGAATPPEAPESPGWERTRELTPVTVCSLSPQVGAAGDRLLMFGMPQLPCRVHAVVLHLPMGSTVVRVLAGDTLAWEGRGHVDRDLGVYPARIDFRALPLQAAMQLRVEVEMGEADGEATGYAEGHWESR